VTAREIAALVPWFRVLEEAGIAAGRGGRTRCPVHGGDNPTSFSYGKESVTARCFACGWRGDKLAFLQAALGIGFKAALARLAEIAGIQLSDRRKPSKGEQQHARAHREALATARDAYRAWERRRFIELTDTYRNLITDYDEAAMVYGLLERRPHLFSETEARWWAARLAALYHRLAPLEWDLDVLTYHKHEEERFGWWQAETTNPTPAEGKAA
jgi:hypothetical protein